MAAKKTNYIDLELALLDSRIKGLFQYLEDNPFEDIQDRIETFESTRGNPIVKVIASKEAQIKCLKDIMKDLPIMLESLNRLRRLADEKGEDVTKRGGGELPGIFKNRLITNGKKKQTDDEDDYTDNDEDDEDEY